jgi:hypothetical protein
LSELHLSPFHRLLIAEGRMSEERARELSPVEAMQVWSPPLYEAAVGMREHLQPTEYHAADPMFELARELVRVVGVDAIARLWVNLPPPSAGGAVVGSGYDVLTMIRLKNVVPRERVTADVDGSLRLALCEEHLWTLEQELPVAARRLRAVRHG